MLVDTHCHIHERDYQLPVEEVLEHAKIAGVTKMICVGTSEQSSLDAVSLANIHPEIVAAIGVHPHEASEGYAKIAELFGNTKIVAVGEIGLDYFYTHSPKEIQKEALRWQLAQAEAHSLPVIFHVREAFEDFWPILDEHPAIRGVLHSFTDSEENMNEGIKRGLYIGVNGISTFTKDPTQKAMFASIPISNLLFETDSPFLTPMPFRGKVNEPAFVKNVAEFHAELRNISLDEIAASTTANARALFAL